jgi:hypothetical protein
MLFIYGQGFAGLQVKEGNRVPGREQGYPNIHIPTNSVSRVYDVRRGLKHCKTGSACSKTLFIV